MVLSALPIFILIPLVEWSRLQRGLDRDADSDVRPLPAMKLFRGCLARAVAWTAVGAGAYLVTNPYILINAFANREVLQSNFGNSLAMYEIARLDQGLLRVIELTIEGAGLPVFFLGVVAAALAVRQRYRAVMPLLVPALLLTIQFVLLGAGKPAEYGRFGVFANAALAIGTGCLLAGMCRAGRVIGLPPLAIALTWTAISGWAYLANFRADCSPDGTRVRAAELASEQGLGGDGRSLWVTAEPAPYGCPPLAFTQISLLLCPEAAAAACTGRPLLTAHDGKKRLVSDARPPPAGPGWSIDGRWRTPISWANKPFILLTEAGNE
jgi:hypothetical protein